MSISSHNSPPGGDSFSRTGVDPWLLVRPNPNTCLRLFCFPYAGGGASQFLAWHRRLPKQVDVCPIQLPGRERRSLERPIRELGLLVESLAPVIQELGSVPYACFGHSMGAIVSFELARALRRRGHPGPRHLFLSGHRAPHLPDRDPPLHTLPDPELKARLAELNGSPEEVLANDELMSIFLPIIRADAAVCETYVFTDDTPLDCPFTVLGGLNDRKVTVEELAGWAQHTRGSCTVRTYPGDHFYLREPQCRLLDTLTAVLQQHLASLA